MHALGGSGGRCCLAGGLGACRLPGLGWEGARAGGFDRGYGCLEVAGRCRASGALRAAPAALRVRYGGDGRGERRDGRRLVVVRAAAGDRVWGRRMSGLPGGAVTFLFSDMEGSTRLVKALRERYPRVLAEHRRLIRAAIAGQAGYEVDTQGDAFFVAFGSAKQAVLCALEIQRALAAHDWPAGAPVRVRIGIHTGHAVPAEGAYTGLAVHRAARICAAARGGQVLVSQATQTIIEDDEEEPGFTFVDVGEQKLKDLDRPVRLFELAAPGLDTRAPPATGQPAGGAAPEASPAATGGLPRDVAGLAGGQAGLAQPAGTLSVGLLGPVEVGPAGEVMTLVAQPRLRVLLGLLGVAEGRMVTAEALVDGVWGEEWSPGREKNLHALVYQLRRRLAALEPGGEARLVRAGAGYRLVLGPGELDVAVFRDRAGRGREAARAGDAAGARELFGQALGVWRGAALADAALMCPRLAGEAVRLEELRLAVTEERIGCDLVLGRHGEVAGELAGLVAEFPLRERLAALLMTALYRCGRRGEALAAYDGTRRVLAGQLGLDPGPELAGLQVRVLADDPALAAPAAVPGGAAPAPAEAAAQNVVPRQLPAGAAFFAGREAELKQLDELLDQAGPADGHGDSAGGAVVISAVAGMAGVGKTALAVHWARRVAGRFPDGQLYVNLRGYDAEGAAVTPEEVTGWFLAALGVPAFQIPAGAQARCGLYRSVLAGRRVLVVLDNARDAAQVRPLLPGSPGCLVVVTSRSALAGLAAAEGARPLRLGPLGAEEGVRLLAARLGQERVAAEPGAVTELTARCGYLPLALAVMAARADADPGLPLGVLAGQLALAADAEAAAAGGPAGAGAGRLEVLETGDPATSLRQLLSWSYRQLSPPAATMSALLGVHCGPDITAAAAASLAGVSRAEAGRALAELAGASLAAEHRPGRYVLHDLVRGYAAELARQALGEAGIQAAVGRSLDHYLHTIARIALSSGVQFPFAVAPPAPGVLPEQLAGEAELQDWARAEHQVMLQAIAQAAAVGFITHAWQIFHNHAWLVGGAGYWADIRAVGQPVLDAAEPAGDQVALGWTHAIIGRYGAFLGTGAQDLARALGHFRQAGDLSGQAWAHLFASVAYGVMGNWAEGVTQSGQALALFRQTGELGGQGWALAGLGYWHARLGNYEPARGYAQQALEAGPATGDPTSLASAWEALGLVHSGLGEPRQAISCYRQGLAFIRELKHPMGRALLLSLLAGLGDACRADGDLPAAVQAWQQALRVLDDLGWPDLLGIHARLEQAGPPSPPG
jgi:class 3 adenylate cyclase/DNA-binding SARP family transcriptional activator/tetratricopeptide (TPR) repeat protein